ncbi:VOC family protein [Winogradskyella sp.]|uniref:VOC family protein n=1 Tax=Winogradskyella sp. TaxID=1883156 RepID=UPI0025D3169A|nr:VOC family protein [Winogradskyella sp.]
MSDKKSLILGLRTTIYMVDDIVKATEWYSKAFNTKPYFNEPFYVGFNIGGYELGLQSEERDLNSKTENVFSYWGVDDIEEAYKYLISLGATKHEEPNNVGDDIMVASLYDPWNNVIGIIYNPHFKLSKKNE